MDLLLVHFAALSLDGTFKLGGERGSELDNAADDRAIANRQTDGVAEEQSGCQTPWSFWRPIASPWAQAICNLAAISRENEDRRP
jgi:hypothetical protein